MMRPIVLYTMPRSKSTPAMQACLRTIDLGEAWKPKKFISHSEIPSGDQNIDHMVTDDQIKAVLDKIDLPDTKVKIIGHQVARLSRSVEWWSAAQAAQKHEIYVLERDYRTCLHSWLLAEHFGYFKDTERSDRNIIATDYHVKCVKLLLENHCRFYPVRGFRITWDALPATDFSKYNVTMVDQDSLYRLKLVKNLDWWQGEIDKLLKELHPSLDACRDSLPAWHDHAVSILRGQQHDQGE